MAAGAPGSRLQSMLQAAVQSVQWTYSLFWQICPQQGILIWGDGYYNGAIKTRKTVQPMEVSAEEASLQRSQQLRDLYDSLSAGETNQQTRRPCAALSPEDLTESEWFYLMCVSFSFPPGVGLPGKAYARRQHVWLTGANEVDSKTFSRAILAKSARIQTVVCIPILDGVVEFGSTEKVEEEPQFIQHVKTFFSQEEQITTTPPPPKPALSEHSTSNPTASTGHPLRFHSPPTIPTVYTAVDPPATNNANANANANNQKEEDNEDDDDEDEDEDEDEDGQESDSEAGTGRALRSGPNVPVSTSAAEPSELMQLEMSEDIRLGSPDDGSNNLDSNFRFIQPGDRLGDYQRRSDFFKAESSRRWNFIPEAPLSAGSLQTAPSGPPLDDLSQEDTHYSQTVSMILQNQSSRLADSTSSPAAYHLSYSLSNESAFAKWTNHRSADLHHLQVTPSEGTSQWLLKYILFSVPYLHNKYHEENSPKSRDTASAAAANRFRKGTPQDELSANHVLAERRRREKLNERFIILRSLVPFVTKMDKASILGDTIEYVKQLRKKIQDLEARNSQMEQHQQQQQRLPASRSSAEPPQRMSNSKDQRSGVTSTRTGPNLSDSDKRKMRIVEGSNGGAKPKVVVEASPPPPPLRPPPVASPDGGTSVEVSIIESDALIELQCGYREGLLLDMMQMLRELRIEIIAVQSSLSNNIFVAELRAKVKDNVSGKKLSIMEVKRAIRQIIPHDC